MMVIRQFRIWIGLSVAVGLLAGCGGLGGEPPIVATLQPNPTRVVQVQPISLPESAPDIAIGEQIFAENCTRCHGLTGKGDGEMVLSGQVVDVPDFTDPLTSQDASPLAWYEIVTNGRLEKLMPPWRESLNDSQRWAVTLYVYTLANTPEQIAQGEAVWTSTCAECHGETGEGTDKGAPLSNLLETSTGDLLTLLANGIPDKMPALADELSVEDRTAVVAYARTLALANVGSSPHQVASVPTTASEGANPQPATTEEASAATTVSGVVMGSVVNMTAGGIVPSDLIVNLHVIGDGNTPASGDVLQTTLNSDNSYRFENVPIQAGRQYVVTTSYNGTAFNSEVLEGDPALPQLELPLNIYEVAADPANIQIDGILTMVQTQATQLEVVQIFNFINVSDHVYLKQENGTSSSVSIRLPPGAVYEDFSGSGYLISNDGTQVTDTQAVMPGSTHVMHLAFTLPYAGSANIEQALDYQLDGPVEIMLGSDGMSIMGESFTELGTRQLGDRTYQSYGGNLSRDAGEALRYQVQSSLTTPQAGTAVVNSISPFAYVLIGAGLLAIGAAFGFFMRERVTPKPVTDHAASDQVNVLMQQIAELDRQHNDGKISKAKYQQQRAVLKSQLVPLMKDKTGSNSRTTADPES